MERQKKIFDSYEYDEAEEDVKVVKNRFMTAGGLVEEILIRKTRIIPATPAR